MDQLKAGRLKKIIFFWIKNNDNDFCRNKDGVLLFNQLPLVQFEGMNMVQSGSTTRYLYCLQEVLLQFEKYFILI